MIDINFDFHVDSYGKDPIPDEDSLTLKKYHKILWSKPLPNGKIFDLRDDNDAFKFMNKQQIHIL